MPHYMIKAKDGVPIQDLSDETTMILGLPEDFSLMK